MARTLFTIPTIREYFIDLEFVLGVISDGPAKSFAFRRLKYLSSKFTMYSLLNEYQEIADMKRVPHRDFYNLVCSKFIFGFFFIMEFSRGKLTLTCITPVV